MDINQVRFGSYSIGNQAKSGAKSGKEMREEVPMESKNEGLQNKISAEEMFNAMNIAGLHNKAQINIAAHKEVDPMQYLSEERISDIEAMMGEFESGVGNIANIIETEFPNVFADDQKNALAARIFAAE